MWPVYDLTDHLPNFIIFHKSSSLPSSINLYKRDYSKFDKIALLNEIEEIDWEMTFPSDNNPTNMFHSFYDKISTIVDKHIPIRKISKRQLKFNSKPWITSAIKKSIQVKNKLYRIYLKTKSSYCHSKFKYYRNKLNHLLKIAKRQCYDNYFIQNVNDSKQLWKGIKEIIKTKPNTNQKSIKIFDNIVEITDPKMIANAFNN